MASGTMASREAALNYENSLREIDSEEQDIRIEAWFGRRSGLINVHA
jgi:hypothetical protein